MQGFPTAVKKDMSRALFAAQNGETVVRFLGDYVYMLHALQKKSKRGIATTKKDVEMLRRGWPLQGNILVHGTIDMATKRENVKVGKGSGNIFTDLGLANPGQEELKAKLTLQIYRIIKDRDLNQTEAAELLGIKQPHVSALLRSRSGNFSVGRLMEFLMALGHDVEVNVKPTSNSKQCGEMLFHAG